MKKGAFYILLSGNKTEAKTGWIYTTSRNTYGIDNRGDKARPRWIITDILTGYEVGSHYPTRAAAIDQIERMDDFISEKHSAPEHAAARAAIAEAYRNGTPAAEETPAARYIIEFYNSNGTPRAEIRRAAASAPELDIPAADIDAYKKEITKNTRGKVEFLEEAPAELAYLLRRPTESHSAPQSATETTKATAEEITPEETPKDPQRDAETRAAITDGETPAEAAEEPQSATEDTQSALYIVQCRSPRRSWTDYSSPAPLEKCEEIKATAEARRTCSNNGELLQYRITEAAPADAAESPAETQTDNTAEARRTPAETRGDTETTSTPPADADSRREPHNAPTVTAPATAGSTAPNAPGLQANKASPNAA